MNDHHKKARRKRAVSRTVFFRFNSCSQMRSTRQPFFRSVRVTSRSRLWFAANFLRQKAALFQGFVACFGQPCQKQPSTKTASLSLGKTKSGRTRNAPPSPLWGESDATLADRMGEGLGVRVLGEVLFRAPRSAIRICLCLLHPVMPCARKTRTSASSVALFPRERMRDITSLRLALVKMSATGFF